MIATAQKQHDCSFEIDSLTAHVKDDRTPILAFIANFPLLLTNMPIRKIGETIGKLSLLKLHFLNSMIILVQNQEPTFLADSRSSF